MNRQLLTANEPDTTGPDPTSMAGFCLSQLSPHTLAANTHYRSAVTIILLAILAVLSCQYSSAAEHVWNGASAVDDNWSTGNNWVGSAAPDTPDDTVSFGNTDLGNTNLVDQDWVVSGMTYSNDLADQWHITDLGANILTISNAVITAGFHYSNSLALFTNGTLLIGTPSAKTDIIVGKKTETATQNAFTGNVLRIACSADATNIGTIAVGYNWWAGIGGGALDMRDATLTGNKLKADTIHLAGWGYTSSSGEGLIKLPPSLTSIEVGDLIVGYGGYTVGNTIMSRALIDIGGNSTLNELTITGDFTMGYAADYGHIGYQSPSGPVDYLPTGIVFTIGQPGDPSTMMLGASDRYQEMVISNGTFQGYLDELTVGITHLNKAARGTNLLDLSSATVQIGDEANKIKVHTFRVGYMRISHRGPRVTLKLPTNITDIITGEFIISEGGDTRGCGGTLDIGQNSALRHIMASNIFYIGKNSSEFGRIGYQTGSEFVTNLPTGFLLEVGTTNSPALMGIGGMYYSVDGKAELVLSNSTLRAYLSSLEVGVNRGYGGSIDGLLDLRTSTVQIGDTTNKIKLDSLLVGAGPTTETAYQGTFAYGTLKLPPAITEINVGDFFVGRGGNAANRGARGIIDIGSNSLLNTFIVTNGFYLGANGADYGRIGYQTGGGFVDYLPPDLDVQIGASNAPVPMFMGQRMYGSPAEGKFALNTNSTFAGYASKLVVGVNLKTWTGINDGRLDLTNATLTALEIDGNALIGCWTNNNNVDAQGRVYLPEGDASINGNLYIGDVDSDSLGLLELYGTRVSVQGTVDIGPTGSITNHVQGTACGLDLAGSTPGALSISNGATMHISFEADPLSRADNYWGFRMNGDNVSYLQGLTNSARISVDIAGLSPYMAKKCGVYYDLDDGYTYIGCPQSPSGTMYLIR